MQVKYTREQMMLLLVMGGALATRHCTVPQSALVLPNTSSSAGRTPSPSLPVPESAPSVLCTTCSNCQSMHNIPLKPVVKVAAMPDWIAVRTEQV